MITPEQIHPQCHELTERRRHFLAPRSTEEIARVLGDVSRRWLDPSFSWRARALTGMTKVTGFSPQMTERIIGLLFLELTEDRLGALVEAELGKRRDQETGPPLLAQVFSGNIPNPAVVSIICGLLVKSASFCKVSSRDPLFPSLYLASLHEAEPELAACVQLQRWPGGARDIEQALFREAGMVVAYGNDESLHSIQSTIPAGAPFLGFGHKLGFAVIEGTPTDELVAQLAEDVSLYDQQGCLSPHVVYVEGDARSVASRLATAMEAFHRVVPRGTVSLAESAAISRVRHAYEFRAASDPRVAMWGSTGSDAWTVIYEEEPMFTTSPLNRVIFVKPLRDLEQSVIHVRPYLHNVGLACPLEHRPQWESRLGQLGAARVCPIGQMQKPPLDFAAGIRPRLGELMARRDG